MKRREFSKLSLFLLGLGLANCSDKALTGTVQPSKETDDKLQIWWQEGFYPEETDALDTIIANWEQESGIQVDLTTIPQKDILQEIENALDSNNLPDICYTGVGDLAIFPRLAWNDQLVDVSDVIEPLKDWYDSSVLAGVNYQNNTLGQRSYYAVPIMQSGIHIHYWQDMLTQIGRQQANIPKDWNNFWQFWQQVQPSIRQTLQSDIHSIGMPMSLSLDTYNNFEQFMEAYDVKMLDDNGSLLVNEPQVRQGVINALTQYTSFYKNGNVTPEALNWDNTGNNIALLSRNSLLTVNHTLSAPGSQRQDEDVYYNQLTTVEWPNKPNGDPMRHVVELKQVVIFQSSKKQQIAKDFLAYLAQPDNLQAYAKGAQARYLPVMPKLIEDPFWQNSADSHISVALQQLKNTRPAYQVFNPAYGEVAAQNVWGTVIKKIGTEELSVEQAADEAIKHIKQIFADWS